MCCALHQGTCDDFIQPWKKGRNTERGTLRTEQLCAGTNMTSYYSNFIPTSKEIATVRFTLEQKQMRGNCVSPQKSDKYNYGSPEETLLYVHQV